MTKRHHKGSDGKYKVAGKKFDVLIGSRAQVWHGTAYKTTGGLKKCDLVYNKHGRVVSRRKFQTAKKENRLKKHGWGFKKGSFGAVQLGTRKRKHTRKRR